MYRPESIHPTSSLPSQHQNSKQSSHSSGVQKSLAFLRFLLFSKKGRGRRVMQKGRLKRECEWKAAVCHLTACCIESFYAHAQNNQNSCTFPPCPGQFFKHLLNGLSMAGERKNKYIHMYVSLSIHTCIHRSFHISFSQIPELSKALTGALQTNKSHFWPNVI